MAYSHIIFDLDGTLIDSSPSVLECIARTLSQAGLQPAVPLDASLVGPPLQKILEHVSGVSDIDRLAELAVGFKAVYDSDGYRTTLIYPGVEKLLQGIAELDIGMSIATNKRLVPTQNIFDMLGWDCFGVIGTPDSGKGFSSKAALLKAMLDDMHLEPRTVLYVGDTWADSEAAEANGLQFCAVTWGYDEFCPANMKPRWSLAETPDKLLELIQKHGKADC